MERKLITDVMELEDLKSKLEKLEEERVRLTYDTIAFTSRVVSTLSRYGIQPGSSNTRSLAKLKALIKDSQSAMKRDRG